MYRRSRMIMICCLLSLLVTTIQAFRSSLSFRAASTSMRTAFRVHGRGKSEVDIMPTSLYQKGFTGVTSKVAKAASLAILVSSGLVASGTAEAKVFIDTDLYGDKELKIATINKLKQKLRDAINKDNSVAPCMLELAINDALGYNVESTDGGPDGSIQFETEVPGNERLKKAVDVCKQIKKDLQRTNTVSFADIVAFGGAEALETAGCSRITVQIGRDDAKTPNKLQFQGDKAIDWSSNELKASDIRKSFEKSGLSVKEMGVLVSALGDQAFEDLVPSTFGSRDKMYGAKMGKGNFGITYLKALQKGSSDDNLRAVLTGDPQVLEIVKKAAGSDANFQRDVAEAYLKMTLLGEAYSTRNS